MFQARIIESTPNSITVESVSEPCELHLRLVRDGVTSMEAMLRAAAARWRQRPCLGTRTVLGEEDEPQPNGRVFKKVCSAGDMLARIDRLIPFVMPLIINALNDAPLFPLTGIINAII